jgi:hypothetical protein
MSNCVHVCSALPGWRSNGDNVVLVQMNCYDGLLYNGEYEGVSLRPLAGRGPSMHACMTTRASVSLVCNRSHTIGTLNAANVRSLLADRALGAPEARCAQVTRGFDGTRVHEPRLELSRIYKVTNRTWKQMLVMYRWGHVGKPCSANPVPAPSDQGSGKGTITRGCHTVARAIVTSVSLRASPDNAFAFSDGHSYSFVVLSGASYSLCASPPCLVLLCHLSNLQKSASSSVILEDPAHGAMRFGL